MTKSEFIRKHPNLKPAEVVAKAKAEGLDISATLVRVTRYQDRKRGADAQPRKRGRPRREAPTTKSTGQFIEFDANDIIQRALSAAPKALLLAELEKRLG